MKAEVTAMTVTIAELKEKLAGVQHELTEVSESLDQLALVGSEQQIPAVIDMLEKVRKYRAMFFQPVDGTSATNFVCGFSACAGALGLPYHRDVKRWAEQNRGWELQAMGPLPQMAERGMTADEMAVEIIAIEIDTWRSLLADQAAPAPGQG